MKYKQEEFTSIINQYKDMVYRIALNHVGNKADADDVSQEVFLAFFKKGLKFNSDEHIKAWLIRTTLNLSKKVIYSSWRVKTTSLNEQAETTFTFETELENTVYEALVSLPYKYRSVLHLFYFEDMPIAEISTVLNIKSGTVKMQLSRGRNLLKSKISSDDFVL